MTSPQGAVLWLIVGAVVYLYVLLVTVRWVDLKIKGADDLPDKIFCALMGVFWPLFWSFYISLVHGCHLIWFCCTYKRKEKAKS